MTILGTIQGKCCPILLAQTDRQSRDNLSYSEEPLNKKKNKNQPKTTKTPANWLISGKF